MAASQDAEDRLAPPAPARSHVPEWYRKATRFRGGDMKVSEYGLNKDIKLCVPFLDALTSGYVVELPCDILIERDENGTSFFWHESIRPMEIRPKDMAATLPRPHGHDSDMYAWNTYWGAITPPDYSILVTHPLNRFDLPFTTTSGIMDSDKYSIAGQVPFFLKKDFSGVIPAGTPIMQLIPVKRESWKHQIVKYDRTFIQSMMYQVQRYLYGGYKKFLWQKKAYD